jgi:hypothetical protein
MNNNARTHIKLIRKGEGSQRRSYSIDPRPMVTKPSNTTDRASFSHRRQTIHSHLQKRIDDEDRDTSTHVSPTNGTNFDEVPRAVSCATCSFANSPLRKNKPTLRRLNSFSGSDMLVQTLENDCIPRSRPLPTRQGSSRNVQRHMSCSGPESTNKLDLGSPISITSVNTTSENDSTKEPHPSSKAESSEVNSGFRPALTRQVADLDDPAVTSAAKRKPCKTDSRIVSSLRGRSFQTRRKSSGSIDRDKNRNSTTVAKSMMSLIEGELPPTTPFKQKVVKGSEKSRRPPKPSPPLPPLPSEEARRRRSSRRSGSGPSPFQLDQSCKDSIRHLDRKSGSNACPFELDQSCDDDFPPCSFHGPCEEDIHAIFEFRRISTTTIDGIVHLSLPDEVEVEGPRIQRRTRSINSKSRQRSSLGSKTTRSKSSSRSYSRVDENEASGLPPRPKKKSTEKRLHEGGARQRSRSRGANKDSPVTSSSSGADHDIVYEFKRVVTSSREVDRHPRRRSASIDGDHESTNQGGLKGFRKHNSFNGAEEVASIDLFLNGSDESMQNQRPKSVDESSLGKVERSDGPGFGSSCSSFGNGTKPNREKSFQTSSLQLVLSVDPEERSISSTSVSTHTCKKMRRQKSKGSTSLEFDSMSALAGVGSGTDSHSAVGGFNKSAADRMQVSNTVVGSNKKNDLRRSSSFNGSDAIAILNKSSSDFYCFTTGAIYAPKKRSARPARSRSFSGPSSGAADSYDDGFSGVFVPVSRVHF